MEMDPPMDDSFFPFFQFKQTKKIIFNGMF